MNMQEYIYLCCYQISADPKMSIKMLSPTMIRIRRFYHHWFQINKANAVHVFDCRNSIAFIFHMEYTKLVKTVLDDGKVRHGILMRTYWKYSIVTSGGDLVKENIFLYISTRKTFLYISFLHFCIVLYNYMYKYLLEERGERDFLLRLYLCLRVMDR